MNIINDIDNLKNSKKLYCSVWIEIKNWIELNWMNKPILDFLSISSLSLVFKQAVE